MICYPYLVRFHFNVTAAIVLLVVLLLNSAEFAVAQSKRANIWRFSDTGIDFNQTPPALLPKTEQRYARYSNICDENGNLVFFTDGRTVWSANEQVMSNGTGLDAHVHNYSQQVIIIPHPTITDFYYIFTISDEFWYHKILYHEVDFRSNPNGEVSSKNNLLGGQKLLVKISAIHVADENKYWVIVQGSLANAFYAYLLDENGVHSVPVVSTTSTVTGHLDYGQIKFSPNGTLLAVGNSIESDNVELFKFDRRTGRLSDEITVPFLNDANSLEFSPDSRYLYVVSREGACPKTSSLMQFDLHHWQTTDVIHSKKNITTDPDLYGQLQLAPDGKIYMGNMLYDCTANTYVHVINNPNQPGLMCNFQENAFSLNGSFDPYHLPNFVTSFLYIDPCSFAQNIPTISLDLDSAYIIGSTYPQVKVNSPPTDFIWNDGSKDSVRTFLNEGTYWVNAASECGDAYDTVQIKRLDIFIPNIITSNDDAMNDSFVINENSVFDSWQLNIFNRGGQSVFVSHDYKNDWHGAGLGSGVYYYYLINPKYGIEFKGWIHLVF